jgi:hypothetical protein
MDGLASPRLAGQPIFYPVPDEECATMIAREWNVKHSGVGYVARFRVRKEFLDGYAVSSGGRSNHSGVLDPRRGFGRAQCHLGGSDCGRCRGTCIRRS